MDKCTPSTSIFVLLWMKISKCTPAFCSNHETNYLKIMNIESQKVLMTKISWDTGSKIKNTGQRTPAYCPMNEPQNIMEIAKFFDRTHCDGKKWRSPCVQCAFYESFLKFSCNVHWARGDFFDRGPCIWEGLCKKKKKSSLRISLVCATCFVSFYYKIWCSLITHSSEICW